MVDRWGAATSAGQVRSVNQDAHLASAGLYIVADGMGGHAGGETASREAIRALVASLGTQPPTPELFTHAIRTANDHLVRLSQEHPGLAGMGTTVSAVARVDVGGIPHVLVLNIGDSRVYRFSDGAMTQVTIDHSEVAELVAAGVITAREARTHPSRNVITRSLGTDPGPIADVWLFPINGANRFVVCSDGLHTEITDSQIADIATAHPNPQDAAAALLQAAEEHGARDNVTVVVADLRDTSHELEGDETLPRRQGRQ